MSEYKVYIDTEALQDIQQAIDWYNERLPGLGEEFHKQVNSQIGLLKDFPAIHRIRYAAIRCCLVKRFPFHVHYGINEQKKLIEILAVFHTSRNPKIWEERVKKR